ncbi:MAG: hypothetical protein HYZ29_35405 [Myxococcales bacterium]|nr:hypothetical protein [Myxococcales bacterium]
MAARRMNRPPSEAAVRAAERREREDAAPRIHTVLPRLASLRLEIDERTAGGGQAGAAHIRRIVVEHAPALFLLACGDSACRDGGHDITLPVMRALDRGETRFEGEDACRGSLGSGYCSRTVHWVGVATFNP